ncbi:MAG: hypothetical protein KDD56_03935 [Bdellovibrionales bacterium]|nr:hypothetical protein [Bdellovibrionales bacterium]
MANDNENNRKSSISGIGKTKGVKAADEVTDVKKVEQTKKISGVGKVDSVRIRQATRMMTAAERENFFNMIEEEAEKLFAGTGMSEEKKSVIKDAVKMAVDASIVEDEE